MFIIIIIVGFLRLSLCLSGGYMIFETGWRIMSCRITR